MIVSPAASIAPPGRSLHAAGDVAEAGDTLI